MIIKGKDVMLYMNSNAGDLIPVCHSRTCTLSCDREMLETTGPDGADRHYLPSYRGGKISADGLVVYQDQVNGINILEWLQSGSLVYFKFATSAQGGLILSGRMYIEQWEMTGDVNDVATFTFNGPIDGPLVINKSDIVRQVYLSDIAGIRLAGCPNPYPVGMLWYDGTFIGVANNAGDAMTLFNNYPGNQYYQLTGTDGACNFTMAIKWDSPDLPGWVPAVPGAGFVIGPDNGQDDVIGQDGNNNNVIGPTA